MKQDNLELLMELVDSEISHLEYKLEKNEESRARRESWGDRTDIHDLTKARVSARLILARETLWQLIDWSNE